MRPAIWSPSFFVFPSRDRQQFALAAAISGVALGNAIQIGNGGYHATAIVWLTFAHIVMALGMLIWRSDKVERAATWAIGAVLLTAIAWQLYQLHTKEPAIYIDKSMEFPTDDVFHAGMALGMMCGVAATFGNARTRRFAIPVMLATYVVLSCVIIRISPNPRIDVFSIYQRAVDLLVRHENPYEMTIVNMYGHNLYYGHLAHGDRVDLGFGYPPLSLLIAMLGRVLLGDYRYTLVAAIAGAGAFIAYSRPSPYASAGATLLLFTPRTFFVVEQGWADPYVLLFLTMSVFAVLRARWLFPLALAGLWTSKQYGIVLVPTVLLLRPYFRSWRAFMGAIAVALAIAAIVTLPLVLWNAKAAYYNMVTVLATLPPRTDSMNYLGWWHEHYHETLPIWLGFASIVVANVIVLVFAPRTAAGFAGSVAWVLLVFFMTGKQAFCNYYHFILGGFFAALGATAPWMREVGIRFSKR